jgi:cell division protein ZapA
MSGKKQIVRVTIVGEEFSLRSDATPQHAQEVAGYVDQSIRRVMANSATVDARKAAILAALQITDELLRTRERMDELATSIRALAADVRRVLPPNKRGGVTALD